MLQTFSVKQSLLFSRPDTARPLYRAKGRGSALGLLRKAALDDVRTRMDVSIARGTTFAELEVTNPESAAGAGGPGPICSAPVALGVADGRGVSPGCEGATTQAAPAEASVGCCIMVILERPEGGKRPVADALLITCSARARRWVRVLFRDMPAGCSARGRVSECTRTPEKPGLLRRPRLLRR